MEPKWTARSWDLRRLYGMSLADFEEMLQAQGRACAICRSPFPEGDLGKRAHVDHDHVTRRVRGILCAACNSGLGKLGDSAEGLRRALAYLERRFPSVDEPVRRRSFYIADSEWRSASAAARRSRITIGAWVRSVIVSALNNGTGNQPTAALAKIAT